MNRCTPKRLAETTARQPGRATRTFFWLRLRHFTVDKKGVVNKEHCDPCSESFTLVRFKRHLYIALRIRLCICSIEQQRVLENKLRVRNNECLAVGM